MIRQFRLAATALALVVLGLAGLAPTPARAVAGIDIWTGACPVVSFNTNQPGRAVPTGGTVSIGASGNCAGKVPTSTLPVSGGGGFSLTASSVSFGCFSGVVTGRGSVWAPGLEPMYGTITAVNHGGTVSVTILIAPKLAAVGEFAATTIAGCSNNGALNGLGSLTYFDPTMPDVPPSLRS